MQLITLPALPRQSFTLVINNFTYLIRIYDVGNGMMLADVNINGVDISLGVRCLQGELLMPSPSQEQGNGNFMFLTDDQTNPYWPNFGVTASLYYISPQDIASAL